MNIIDHLALMMVPIIIVIIAVYTIGGLGIFISYLINRYKDRDNDLSGKVCPICGKGILVKRIIEEKFIYEDEVLEVSGYIIYECMICGEAIVDRETLDKSGKILVELVSDKENKEE